MKNPMNSTNQIFSKTAAASILNVKEGNINQVELWQNCVFVKMNGRPPKMVSIKKFQQNFTESRKQRSSELEVIPVPLINGFVVKNPKRNTQYMVHLMGDKIECGCEDFNRHSNQDHHCCKHIYAVLGYLGYSSLKDFISK